MFSESYNEVPDKFFNERSISTKNDFKLEDITVHFGKARALENVNLEIKSGEIVFLTGASGAGKTTLLNILAQNIRPTTGSITVRKATFSSQVFQDLRLIEKMTCRENMMFAFDPSLYKNKKEFLNDLIELSKILGIKDKLDLKIKDANGGLKQKVAIIRALLSRPNIFIADEPTSSLDFENAKRLFDLLNIYNSKRNMTIVWASHNRDLVKKFSGRILHLDKGKLLYSGHACFI